MTVSIQKNLFCLCCDFLFTYLKRTNMGNHYGKGKMMIFVGLLLDVVDDNKY